jgi:putative addiction module CopG family antidote
MVSFNIAVPESARDFIQDQVSAGRFRDTDEYILALIEADRSRKIREEIETKLLEGLRSPSALMEDSEWDEIRQTGEKLVAGKQRR